MFTRSVITASPCSPTPTGSSVSGSQHLEVHPVVEVVQHAPLAARQHAALAGQQRRARGLRRPVHLEQRHAPERLELRGPLGQPRLARDHQRLQRRQVALRPQAPLPRDRGQPAQVGRRRPDRRDREPLDEVELLPGPEPSRVDRHHPGQLRRLDPERPRHREPVRDRQQQPVPRPHPRPVQLPREPDPHPLQVRRTPRIRLPPHPARPAREVHPPHPVPADDHPHIPHRRKQLPLRRGRHLRREPLPRPLPAHIHPREMPRVERHRPHHPPQLRPQTREPRPHPAARPTPARSTAVEPARQCQVQKVERAVAGAELRPPPWVLVVRATQPAMPYTPSRAPRPPRAGWWAPGTRRSRCRPRRTRSGCSRSSRGHRSGRRRRTGPR